MILRFSGFSAQDHTRNMETFQRTWHHHINNSIRIPAFPQCASYDSRDAVNVQFFRLSWLYFICEALKLICLINIHSVTAVCLSMSEINLYKYVCALITCESVWDFCVLSCIYPVFLKFPSSTPTSRFPVFSYYTGYHVELSLKAHR